jgi:hypothetical protein
VQPIIQSGRDRTLSFLRDLYDDKLERYKVKAQERMRALRHNPQQVAYVSMRQHTLAYFSIQGACASATGGGQNVVLFWEIEGGSLGAHVRASP